MAAVAFAPLWNRSFSELVAGAVSNGESVSSWKYQYIGFNTTMVISPATNHPGGCDFTAHIGRRPVRGSNIDRVTSRRRGSKQPANQVCRVWRRREQREHAAASVDTTSATGQVAPTPPQATPRRQ